MQKNEEDTTNNQEGPPEQDSPQEQKASNTGRKFWFTRKRPADLRPEPGKQDPVG